MSRKDMSPSRKTASPPAIWAHFARQAAWKDWVIAALLLLNGVTVLAGARLAGKEPDVVTVAPDGKSTFVHRDIASAALLDFIAEQRQQPSDPTVVHFTKNFLSLALSANSSTIDATWSEALSMMGEQLSKRLKQESEAKKLLEAYKAVRVKSVLNIEDIVLVERTKELLQVKATVQRIKSSLLDETRAGASERLVVDLVERIVPRTAQRPDGLEIVDWHFASPPLLNTAATVTHGQ
jgi:4-amino-4-deoxy-L-arabinose transferase-like glycosyltransferase